MIVCKDWFSYSDIAKAYLDCRRRKRNKYTSMEFEAHLEDNLDRLYFDINSGTYKIGRSRVFAVLRPKPREIWAAQFRDRIVHHLIYNEIGEYFERRFIEDTFSCIKGRGTLAAFRRAQSHARKITQNWGRQAHFLQVDIQNFFVSICRDLLWMIVSWELSEPYSLMGMLIKQVIDNDPTVNPIIKCKENLKFVPRHKSLWHCPAGYGLPIGNLTSQFLSNVYLDAFDKFVKHTLKCKYYVRYVDDAVLFSLDRDELYDWLGKMDIWLRNYRGLQFHPNKIHIAPVAQGINFVGHIIKPWRSYPRNMSVGSAKSIISNIDDCLDIDNACESLQSYIGLFRQDNAYHLRECLCQRLAQKCGAGYDVDCTKIVPFNYLEVIDA